MESDKAMLEYVSLIDRLEIGSNKEATIAPLDRPNAIRRTSLKPGQVLMKQGVLYKQRDVFKGWRPRLFVLIDNNLTYYIEGEEGTPKGSLSLSGCSCVAETPTMSEGVEYFPFTLTHPGSSRPYHLSALSKAESDDWMAKINQAVKTNEPQISAKTGISRRGTFTTAGPDSPSPMAAAAAAAVASANEAPATSTVPFKSATVEGGSAKTPSDATADAPPLLVAGNSVLKPEATLKNVPAHLSTILESKIAAMFDAISPGAPGWEIFMDKEGVKGLKRPGQGDLSAIRADAFMPYNILDVFQCVTSVECLMVMDPMRKQQDKLKILSNHSWVEYFRFKEVQSYCCYCCIYCSYTA